MTNTHSSLNDLLQTSHVLAGALKSYEGDLSNVGLNASKGDAIEALANEISALDTKQESLKSDLKACTEELNQKASELQKQVADTKKRLKLEVPQALWTKFSIDAKK